MKRSEVFEQYIHRDLVTEIRVLERMMWS